ncbi:MAG: PorV/PorQ family protein [Candidatus Cloacimonadota bacterium]|nr:MAG: PorV/PorQ family protein [Candidatus Cloacimonadota bacterium]
MKKIHFVIILLLLPALVSGAGTKGAAFLKIPTGSRAIALGEAFTALADDINAIYWNPGGLIYSTNKEFLFMHRFWFLEANYEYLALSLPSSGYGAFGLGISYLGYGEFEAYDRHYQPQGNFSAYDMNVIVSYSQIFTTSLSLGGSFKYISEKIENASGTAYGIDIGGRFHQPRTPYTFAFVIKNIGTSMKLENEGYSLPLEAIFGFSFNLNQITLPVDIGYSTDDGLGLSFGCEYTFANIMSIRGGYKQGATPGGLSGLRAGCGFHINKLYLDYAIAPYAELGNSHIVTLGVKI